MSSECGGQGISGGELREEPRSVILRERLRRPGLVRGVSLVSNCLLPPLHVQLAIGRFKPASLEHHYLQHHRGALSLK